MITVEPFTVKDSLVIFVSVVARHQPRVRSVSVVFRGEDYTIRSSTRDFLTRHSSKACFLRTLVLVENPTTPSFAKPLTTPIRWTTRETATKSGSPTKKIPSADASPANGMQ